MSKTSSLALWANHRAWDESRSNRQEVQRLVFPNSIIASCDDCCSSDFMTVGCYFFLFWASLISSDLNVVLMKGIFVQHICTENSPLRSMATSRSLLCLSRLQFHSTRPLRPGILRGANRRTQGGQRWCGDRRVGWQKRCCFFTSVFCAASYACCIIPDLWCAYQLGHLAICNMLLLRWWNYSTIRMFEGTSLGHNNFRRLK